MLLSELYQNYKKVADTLYLNLKEKETDTYKQISFKDLVANNGYLLNSGIYDINRSNLSQTLANLYSESDEILNDLTPGNKDTAKRIKEQAFSCLLCLYWYYIFKWKKNCSSLNLSDENYVDWLVDCIFTCFYYSPWRSKIINRDITERIIYIENPKYKPQEKYSFDKSINHWLGLKRAKEYIKNNSGNNKLYFDKLSLDTSINQQDKDDSTLYNLLKSEDELYNLNFTDKFIKKLINKHNILEALIIDELAYGEVLNKNHIINLNLLCCNIKNKIKEFFLKFNIQEDISNYHRKITKKNILKSLNIIKVILSSSRT